MYEKLFINLIVIVTYLFTFFTHSYFVIVCCLNKNRIGKQNWYETNCKNIYRVWESYSI